MTQEVAIADWLEELAVYGTASRPQDAETAYHLSHTWSGWRPSHAVATVLI
jgi:hypothetical protein